MGLNEGSRAGGLSDTSPDGGPVVLPARGLLFDNDGVLVDSETSVVTSWRRWAQELDLDPDEVMAAVPGRRAADTVALFVPADVVAGSVATITRFELEGAESTAAVPGVLDLVAQLTGVPWAVVTSGVRELATARLRGAGIDPPEVLVTAEDVAAGKPDPEPYRTGAVRLGIDPADLIVLEDSPSGVAAGLAAGCTVLGIGEPALQTAAPAVVRDLTGARWTGTGLHLPAAALLRRP
ncbi:HAD-IA family hydrolase [Modestobacter sp. SYSU DS0290]